MGLEHRNQICVVRRKFKGVCPFAGQVVVGERNVRALSPRLSRVDDLGSGGLAHYTIVKAEGVFGAGLGIQCKEEVRIQIVALIAREVEQPGVPADGVLRNLRRRCDLGPYQRVGVYIRPGHQPFRQQLTAEQLGGLVGQKVGLRSGLDQLQVPDIQLRLAVRRMGLEHRNQIYMVRRKGKGVGSFSVELVIGKFHI